MIEGVARGAIQATKENSDGVAEATGNRINSNNDNIELLKAVLCTALYPNVVRFFVLLHRNFTTRSTRGAAGIHGVARESPSQVWIQ
jgi:hypothetical protein